MRWVLAVSTDTDRLLEREGGDRKASGVMEGGKSIPWIREDWADFAASQTLCELGSQSKVTKQDHGASLKYPRAARYKIRSYSYFT